MNEPIECLNPDGTFTPEFKNLVDSYVQEEMAKVTTDGKLDRSKAIAYIAEHMKQLEEENGSNV